MDATDIPAWAYAAAAGALWWGVQALYAKNRTTEEKHVEERHAGVLKRLDALDAKVEQHYEFHRQRWHDHENQFTKIHIAMASHGVGPLSEKDHDRKN